MTVKDAIAQFLFHCQYEKNLSPKTLKAYSIDLRQFRVYLETELSVTDLGGIDKVVLRAWVKSLFTDLADKSVKDRFDVCRREGLRGIPREELIGYLRDTADALDFMSEAQQRALEDAQIRATSAPIGEPIIWSDGDARGEFQNITACNHDSILPRLARHHPDPVRRLGALDLGQSGDGGHQSAKSRTRQRL